MAAVEFTSTLVPAPIVFGKCEDDQSRSPLSGSPDSVKFSQYRDTSSGDSDNWETDESDDDDDSVKWENQLVASNISSPCVTLAIGTHTDKNDSSLTLSLEAAASSPSSSSKSDFAIHSLLASHNYKKKELSQSLHAQPVEGQSAELAHPPVHSHAPARTDNAADFLSNELSKSGHAPTPQHQDNVDFPNTTSSKSVHVQPTQSHEESADFPVTESSQSPDQATDSAQAANTRLSKSIFATTSMPSSMPSSIPNWVWEEFIDLYCDGDGNMVTPMNLDSFRNILLKKRPNDHDEIVEDLYQLNDDVFTLLCDTVPLNQKGECLNPAESLAMLRRMRPDKDLSYCRRILNMGLKEGRGTPYAPPNLEVTEKVAEFAAIDEWIRKECRTRYAQPNSWKTINFTSLRSNLCKKRPKDRKAIMNYVLKLQEQWALAQSKGCAPEFLQGSMTSNTSSAATSEPYVSSSSSNQPPVQGVVGQLDVPVVTAENILARKMNNAHITKQISTSDLPLVPDDTQLNLLIPASSEQIAVQDTSVTAKLTAAPLISRTMITDETARLVPQYGCIGSYENDLLFANSNFPFSTFICGVQGSGKSHTTSLMLENAMIPSPSIGRLVKPLSAMVFNYRQFSGNGESFNVSEAAFLSVPRPEFPGHHIKKVTVLYSPSNPAIAKVYARIPNLTAVPFKIKQSDLDSDVMLTLMGLDVSESPPLYMGHIHSILKRMQTAGGPFNYAVFKQSIDWKAMNPMQEMMLKQRLDLLESSLDVKNEYPRAEFNAGEMTIVDMSDPFVDANSACILFKIALKIYLNSSKSTGKMLVLDEAHKYMLDVPASKALTEYIKGAVRHQRHDAMRVIISTQEPTIHNELIALCSLTVIHRFSSRLWFSAIKQHIPVPAQKDEDILKQIETLNTGTALVYSSTAVLGKDEAGGLTTGAGKLMKVNMRMRVTLDGGKTMTAV